MKLTYKIETLEKYKWEGWQTVEELTLNFDRSKRMIQKVINDLTELREVERGILSRNDFLRIGVKAIPIYRRIN